MKWGWGLGGLVGGGLAAALAVGALAAGRGTALQAPPSWAALGGREWTRYAPGEKQAYVAGFLAGGAVADAERAGAQDTAALRRVVDSLFRGGGLRFPFGHVVYATQLDEFYWWDNHVPVPLYLALRDVNVRLKRQGQ